MNNKKSVIVLLHMYFKGYIVLGRRTVVDKLFHTYYRHHLVSNYVK